MGVFNTQSLGGDRGRLKSRVHIAAPLLNPSHPSDSAD
jgi:hypothetical protein